MSLKTVLVPGEMSGPFEEAEKFVEEFFSTMVRDPAKGTIHIGNRRYILVNADSMSVGFFEHFAAMFPRLSPDVAHQAAATALYDIAYNAGRNDASTFIRTMGVEDPVERLSSGPIHFSHTGWARVEISEISKPSPDEDYILVYDHPNSFEADAWLRRIEDGEVGVPTQCICNMNAGYSAGWCTEAFGVKLAGREVFCRAKGNPCCRFVMSHRDRIDEMARRFVEANPDPTVPARHPV